MDSVLKPLNWFDNSHQYTITTTEKRFRTSLAEKETVFVNASLNDSGVSKDTELFSES